MGAPKGNRNNLEGRPKIPVRELRPKEIIMDQVIYWLEMQATAEEIASSFRVTVETLERAIQDTFGFGYLELRKRCEGNGKLSLRRYQFQQSEKNTTMAIWLGKQWLGQRDTSKDEMKEMVTDVVREAIQEISRSSRDASPSESHLENQSSLSHSGPPRPQDPLQSQLGSTRPVEEQPSLQDHPKSTPAGDDDIFLPSPP